MGTHGQSRNIKSTSVIHINKGVPQLAGHLFYGLILPSAGIIQEIKEIQLTCNTRESGSFTSLFGSTIREFVAFTRKLDQYTREFAAGTRVFVAFTRELVRFTRVRAVYS